MPFLAGVVLLLVARSTVADELEEVLTELDFDLNAIADSEVGGDRRLIEGQGHGGGALESQRRRRRRRTHSHSPHVHCPYNHYPGFGGCHACPPGKHGEDSRVACKSCTRGWFQDTPAKYGCKPVRGEYCAHTSLHLRVCVQCGKGSYADGDNSAACKNCPKGYYQDQTKSKVGCKECKWGQFRGSGDSGAKCISCLLGQSQRIYGQSSCVKCDAGKYASTRNQASCRFCSPGYYQQEKQSFSCLGCDFGTFSLSEGATSCADCSGGQFQAETKQTSCQQCPFGQFQPRQGSENVRNVECLKCDTRHNLFQDVIGQSACKTCPTGYLARGDGHQCVERCSAFQPQFSLAGLLLSADPRMQNIAATADDVIDGSDTGDMQLVRVLEIVREVDTDGDEALSRKELEQGLLNRELHLKSIVATQSPLWCTPLQLDGALCYSETADETTVPVALVVKDAKLAIELMGSFHTSNGRPYKVDFGKDREVLDTEDWQDMATQILASVKNTLVPGTNMPKTPAQPGTMLTAQLRCTADSGSIGNAGILIDGNEWRLEGPDSQAPRSTNKDGWKTFAIDLHSVGSSAGSTIAAYVQGGEQPKIQRGSLNARKATGTVTFSPANFTSGMTVQLWAKRDKKFKTSERESLFAVASSDIDASGTNEVAFSAEFDRVTTPSGNMEVLRVTTPSGNMEVPAGDEWTHWTFAYDSASAWVSRFGQQIEKVDCKTKPCYAKFKTTNGNAGIILGSTFQGNLTDFRLWNRGLQCTEPNVKNYWDTPNDHPQLNDLQSWFRFANGSTEDSSSRDVAMTLDKEEGATAFWPTQPHDVSASCMFRNVIVFSSPVKALSASHPSSNSDKSVCENGKAASLSYEWNPNAEDIVNQCIYLNGQRWQEAGPIDQVTHWPDHVPMQPGRHGGTFTVPSSPAEFSLGASNQMELSTLPAYGEAAYTKTFELPMVLPPGSCDNPFNDLVQPYVDDDGVVMVKSRRLSDPQQLAYMKAHSAHGAQSEHSIESASDVEELNDQWLPKALHLGQDAKDHFHFHGDDYSPTDDGYSVSRWMEPYPGMETKVSAWEPSKPWREVSANYIGISQPPRFLPVTSFNPENYYGHISSGPSNYVDFFAVKIFSTVHQTVQLELGYDDELMIWRDGELIFESVGSWTDSTTTNKFNLTQGWHQFLIRQTEYTGDQFWKMRFVKDWDNNPGKIYYSTGLGGFFGADYNVTLDKNRVTVSSDRAWTGLVLSCTPPGSRQTFCAGAASAEQYEGHRCATALVFDGGPLDLSAQLTYHGIEFSFTDTSVKETQFEVVRASKVAAITDGLIVTMIPFSLKGCGRQFSSIVFTDNHAARHPGELYVYAIRALDKDSSEIGTSDAFQYRVPWTATFVTTVTGASGSPVAGVLVEVCHVVPGANIALQTDPTHHECWESITDAYGEVSFDMSVSQESFQGPLQHFKVTPIPMPLGSRDCTPVITVGGRRKAAQFNAECADPYTICSSFEPESSSVAIEHMFSAVRTFVDTSAVQITGEVVFSKELVHDSRCALPGAKITITKSVGDTIEMTADDQGRFSFAAKSGEMVEVSVEYGNHTFEQKTRRVLVGTERVHLAFHDTTREDLELRLQTEGEAPLIFQSSGLVWGVSATTCDYKQDFTNYKDGAFVQRLPALAYDVEITNAPVVSMSSQHKDRQDNELSGELFCSIDRQWEIKKFFNTLGNMKRSVDLEHSPGQQIYMFHTGLCVYNSALLKSFPSERSTTSINNATNGGCTENTYVAQRQAVPFDVKLNLFQQILLDAPHDHVKTVGVGGTVTVSEEVSGDNSPCHPKNGLVADCVKQVANTNETCASADGVPNTFGCALKLSIVPGEPTIWASDNYLRELSLTVMRKPYIHSCPTAGCDSKDVMTQMGVVKIQKFVPVLGIREISGDVKKSYTVSTGATLVFNTIHDPPGGLSSATWAESSTSTHTITINGLFAFTCNP